MNEVMKMKFSWTNTKQQKESNFVIVGVPDESASYSKRRGCNKAPAAIRAASGRDIFERAKDDFLLPRIHKTNAKIFDAGDIEKKKLADFICPLAAERKIPVVIGGDHSITADVLEGFEKHDEKICVVYFDAHPDFFGDSKSGYDSIVCDVSKFQNIDFSSSIEIGMRDPVPAELKKLRSEKKLQTLTPMDVMELGIKRTINEIKRTIDRNIYVSIDMDVVDPAFAPGVSNPLPGGITSSQLVHLVKSIADIGIIGMDIMEVNPAYDIHDTTSHLASRLIMETILNTPVNGKKKNDE